MCDANDPLASTPPPIWPPPKGGVSIDEIWDDGPLLQNYKNMEEHVKKQVERFKNAVRPPPATSMPSKSTHPTPSVPQSLPTQPSATTPGRKKKRNNKHKRGGGAAAAPAATQQQETPVVPVHPAAIVSPAPAPISNPAPPSSPSPPSNGAEQHSSPQHPSSPHPPCSSSSRGPEDLHAPPLDNKAVSNPENVSANTPSAASPTTYATAPSSPARAASGSSPISTGPLVVPAIPEAALAPAPVVPVPAPATIPAPMYPLISHLPVDLMPPPHPPALCPSPSGNSSARFGSPQQPSCLLPTPVEAQTTSSLTASLTTPNGEFNMSLLLRAWYEAGYAMGQAHADQILGLRSGPCGSGDGSDEDEEDDDDEEEVEQQVVQQKKGEVFLRNLQTFSMADTTDGSLGEFHKSNLCSDSSGVSSLHSSARPAMIADSHIISFYANLWNTEIRQTFQLFTRVVESRVQLSWIPSVFAGIRIAQAESEVKEFQLADLSPVLPRHSSTSSYPNLPGMIGSKTTEVAIDLVNTFESRYADDYESLIRDALRIHSSVSATDSSSSSEVELDGSLLCGSYPTDYASLRSRYFKILEGLFVSQINWGRIVAMISFLRALCVVLDTTPGSQSSLSSVDDRISMSPEITNLRIAILHYLIWTTEFIHKQSKLWDWINDHGGWEGLEKFYYGENSPPHSQLLYALALLLAPVGFVSAMRFVLRQLWPR
nr:BCL2 apoptosis inhibitordomain containing protein [Hymenolepis microstoma]